MGKLFLSNLGELLVNVLGADFFRGKQPNVKSTANSQIKWSKK